MKNISHIPKSGDVNHIAHGASQVHDVVDFPVGTDRVIARIFIEDDINLDNLKLWLSDRVAVSNESREYEIFLIKTKSGRKTFKAGARIVSFVLEETGMTKPTLYITLDGTLFNKQFSSDPLKVELKLAQRESHGFDICALPHSEDHY